MRVSFHQLEEYENTPGIDVSVLCSFKTQSHGFLQVGFDGEKTIEYDNEPSLYNYTDAEREYIERTLAIVYRLVFEAPAHERFK